MESTDACHFVNMLGFRVTHFSQLEWVGVGCAGLGVGVLVGAGLVVVGAVGWGVVGWGASAPFAAHNVRDIL